MKIIFGRKAAVDKANVSMYTFPPGPLGLSFGEVMESASPSKIEVIFKVPNTAASKYGALQIGDYLVQVGSYAVHDVDFSVAMELIKSEPRPVQLYFTRVAGAKNQSAGFDMDEKLEHVNAYNFNNETFGIVFEEKSDPSGDPLVYVSEILEDSEARRFSTLKVGDILVKVGHKSVQGLKLFEITETVQSIQSRPLELGFMKPRQEKDKPISEDYCYTFHEKPFGIELGDADSQTGIGAMVTKILADSRAAEGRLIKLHDEIVRIGKTDASVMSFAEVITTLQESETPIEIGFSRAKQA